MFNYQARWDRDLPQNNMRENGNPIAVHCLIEKGRITPESFVWNNQTFDIKKINFRWSDKKGKDTLSIFSGSTKQGSYEIAFSSVKLSWNMRNLLGP